MGYIRVNICDDHLGTQQKASAKWLAFSFWILFLIHNITKGMFLGCVVHTLLASTQANP